MNVCCLMPAKIVYKYNTQHGVCVCLHMANEPNTGMPKAVCVLYGL